MKAELALLQKKNRAQEEKVRDWDTVGPQTRLVSSRLAELNARLRRGDLSAECEFEGKHLGLLMVNFCFIATQEAVVLVNLGNRILAYSRGSSDGVN